MVITINLHFGGDSERRGRKRRCPVASSSSSSSSSSSERHHVTSSAVPPVPAMLSERPPPAEVDPTSVDASTQTENLSTDGVSNNDGQQDQRESVHMETNGDGEEEIDTGLSTATEDATPATSNNIATEKQPVAHSSQRGDSTPSAINVITKRKQVQSSHIEEPIPSTSTTDTTGKGSQVKPITDEDVQILTPVTSLPSGRLPVRRSVSFTTPEKKLKINEPPKLPKKKKRVCRPPASPPLTQPFIDSDDDDFLLEAASQYI